MKRLLVVLALLAALAAPAAALAHPLGNFTVNRHTTIELSGGRVYVQYSVDLAEIPTFQLGKQVRRAGFAREAARKLELQLDGRRTQLQPARAPCRDATRRRRARDAPVRRGLRCLRHGLAAHIPGPQLRFADRLEGGRRPR